MQNLKILGLAFVAVLAIGASAVPAASAALALTAESYPTTVTGASDQGIGNVVTTTAGSISCPNSKYHGALTGPSTTVSITPTFSGCTVFGFPGSFHTNECNLLLHAAGELTPKATIDIVCPAGKEMTITAVSTGTSKCTVHIKPQTGLGTVTVTSVGSAATRELTLDVALSGIHYTHTEGTGLGKCASGTGNNGLLEAKTTITAENLAGTSHVGIFASF